MTTEQAAEYLPVPTHIAKQIAEQYSKSAVLILSLDRAYNQVHTTTYGATAEDKMISAEWGDLCTVAIGCDLAQRDLFEDFRRDPTGLNAARYREATELLLKLHNTPHRDEALAERVHSFLTTIGAL